MNTKTYVICTTARSGSNLLCDLLTSSKMMGNPKEILNLDSMLRPFCERHNLFENDAQISMNHYLNYAIDKLSSKNNIFGMKVLFDQLEPFLKSEAVKQFLQTSQFIWLVRRDVVAQAVSMYIARVTDEWTSMNEQKNLEQENKNRREEVQYDGKKIGDFVKYLTQKNLKWLEFFAINQVNYMQVYYEDILINPNRVCQNICQFCEVEPEYKFSLSNARFKKQGNELNERLAATFRKESLWNLSRQSSEETKVKLREVTIIR